MKNGDRAVLKITDMNTNGEGIGHIDGYTLFVSGALMGDEAEVRLTHTKKNYGFAEVKKLLAFSPDRVKPSCPVSTKCGGCTLQNLSYEAQLRFKKTLVENALKRIGGLDVPVRDVMGMDEPFRYRNKAQYPVGRDGKGRIICGFYARKSHDIVPIRDCVISREANAAIIDEILAFMQEKNIAPYDEKDGSGLVRHILIREGFVTGEIMVCLIINGEDFPDKAELAGRLAAYPEIKSICLNVNTRRSNVILGEKVIPVLGEPFITDYIGHLSFRISPLSFYQVNPVQTKKLYDTVRTLADAHENETLLDLYCGIGTIGLYLADRVKAVYGVEIIPQAIRDAEENAERNGISNAHFQVGASEDIFRDLPEADTVILDPPRKGCEESLLHELAARNPAKIVYVSCNPATLARDLKILAAEGYDIKAVQPVDMFPHTQHIESVALLTRQDIGKSPEDAIK